MLAIAPSEFHKAAGPAYGVPHRLVNQGKIGGVGIEGIMAVDGVARKVDGIGSDEESQ